MKSETTASFTILPKILNDKEFVMEMMCNPFVRHE